MPIIIIKKKIRCTMSLNCRYRQFPFSMLHFKIFLLIFPFGESLQRYQAPDVAADDPFSFLKFEFSSELFITTDVSY